MIILFQAGLAEGGTTITSDTKTSKMINKEDAALKQVCTLVIVL